MTLVTTTNLILSSLTIIGQLVIIGLLIALIVAKVRPGNFLMRFIQENALAFAFIVALMATAGSLFYSEVIGFEPCKLCWFQRIFMYPQVVLLGLALWKGDRRIAIYSVALSVIGAVIAGYHYLLQLGYVSALRCLTAGYSVSCSQKFVLQFEYITIPMMSLTVFLLIILLLVQSKQNKEPAVKE